MRRGRPAHRCRVSDEVAEEDVVGLELEVVGQARDLDLRGAAEAVLVPVQDPGFLVVDDVMVGGLGGLADVEIRSGEVALRRSLEE